MISIMEKIIYLKKVPLFEDITSEELLAISKMTNEKLIEPNDIIFAEGSQQSGLHIIISGKIEISKDNNGRKEVLAQLDSFECFGELSLFVDVPHTATAKALEKAVCLVIDREPFLDLVYEQPTVAIGIIKVFCRRLKAANAKL